MLNLSNITAISVDGTAEGNRNPRLIRIFESIKPRIKFHDIIHFSHVDLDHNENCRVIHIPKIESLSQYSGFVILDLPDYIHTPFCMIIHDDGFPINLNLWDERFLKFDYIGSPWGNTCVPSVSPYHYYNGFVEGGNGGFSIRSSRLMRCGKEIANRMSIRNHVAAGGFLHEDGFFCYQIRNDLKKNGMTYAPYHIAKKFALETNLEDSNNSINEVFGFHGFRHVTFDQAIAMLERTQ
jgi:hypothetical protein